MKLRKIKDKKALELSFAWIFAFIIGAVILFLAIYAAVNLIQFSKYRYYTETANQIANYLNPIVPGLASIEAVPPLKFSQETRIYTYCKYPDSQYFFGRQTIGFSEKSGLSKDWSPPGANITVPNKYLFANDIEEGKKVFLTTTPFFMGYKAADLIFMNTEYYCFVAPIADIESQSRAFNNVNISNSVADCLDTEIKVCFDFETTGCDLHVHPNDAKYEAGWVKKINTGETMTFVGNLMYAAIFSSPDIYNCNINRLGRQISELAYVYQEKIEIAKSRGCDSIIGLYLNSIGSAASNITHSTELIPIQEFAKDMHKENKKALCEIYPDQWNV